MQLPKPSCPQGYTDEDLKQILQPQSYLHRFKIWMNGQTVSICDGRDFYHDLGEYQPSACFQHPHGPVTYTWDLERFLAGKPVID